MNARKTKLKRTEAATKPVLPSFFKAPRVAYVVGRDGTVVWLRPGGHAHVARG